MYGKKIGTGLFAIRVVMILIGMPYYWEIQL